ncbi:MAG: HlyD family secretion protein, partial [Alloprevotella tannerae]|nr:HlyD family secretion protein [Alloprevotella tannerae]
MKKTVIAIAAFTLLVSACDNKEKEFDATGIFEATEVTVSAEATGRLMTFDISEGKLVEAHQQ